jgi:hypothetical protein
MAARVPHKEHEAPEEVAGDGTRWSPIVIATAIPSIALPAAAR